MRSGRLVDVAAHRRSRQKTRATAKKAMATRRCPDIAEGFPGGGARLEPAQVEPRHQHRQRRRPGCSRERAREERLQEIEAIATRINPKILRTQTIQPPDRGILFRLPEKMPRKMNGRPSPRARTKKSEKPRKTLALVADVGQQAQDERPDAGRGDDADGQAHEEGAEVALLGRPGGLVQESGHAELVDVEHVMARANHDAAMEIRTGG